MKKASYFILLALSIALLLYFLIQLDLFSADDHETNQEFNSGVSEENSSDQIEENNAGVENNDFTEPSEVAKAIEKMTLDEKIGQLIFGGIDGTTYTDETKALILDYKLGGILLFKNNLEHPKQALELLNQIKRENKQNRFPILLGVDQEGGHVERLPDEVVSLPTNKVIGDKNDAQFSYEVGTILGQQLNAFGFNLNFAPVLDVNSNASNPVIGDRSFSRDPSVVSELGIKTMQGMQETGVIPVIKHFPGHGDTSVDSHLELPKVEKNLDQLEAMELIPFRRAIEAGADVVMTSHILLSRIDANYPASMSKAVIDGLLRDHLNYDGVVVSDDMTMQAIIDHFDIGDASVKAINAGTDIVIVAHGHDTIIHVIEALKGAVENGELTEERINESVRRVIRLKKDYGIADHVIEVIDIEKLNDLIHNMLE